MANGRFAEFAKRFELVIHDSRDGGTELSRNYSLRGNWSYFLVLDSDGNEIGRHGDYKAFEFDEELIGIIEAFETPFRLSRTRVAEYLLTWIESGDDGQTVFDKLVVDLNSQQFVERESASEQLLSLGEPAFQFLNDYKPDSAEARSRVATIMDQLRRRHETVVHYGLDHDVDYLVRHAEQYPGLARYLERILPVGNVEDVSQWWEENGDRYEWDVDTRKFVRSGSDPDRQTP